MTTDANARYSALDSDRFGRRIYRAEANAPTDVGRLLAECASAGADLLIVRCPAARADVAQALQAAGSRLMDILVYFSAKTQVSGAAPAEATLPIRRFAAADLPALQAAARQAFTGYLGHYHTDSRLDAAHATEGYVDWFRRTTQDPSFAVLVAEQGSTPVGFLSLRRKTAERPAEIVLNAVAPAAQGSGVYDALVKAALSDCRAQAEDEVLTSTQLANVAPQRVWVRNGFEPVESYYTFHHWFLKGDA